VTNSNVSVTFSAADKDFGQVLQQSITIPQGRYIGASVQYLSQRQITLSGFRYQGTSGSVLQDGHYVCSTSTGWIDNGSTSSCSPAAAPLSITTPGGTTASYFSSPMCVATPLTQSATCVSTDVFVDATISSNLAFNIMFDLYNYFQINSATSVYSGTTPGNAFPYLTFGTPGAAIHLSNHTDGTHDDGEITLLFDGGLNLINSVAYQTANFGSPPAGICAGTPYVNATAAPSTGYFNQWGTTFVGLFDQSTGNVVFSANNGLSSGGLNVIKKINQVAGTSVQMNCFADSDSQDLNAFDPMFNSYLGFTYPTFPGYPSSPNANITIVKVTDPTSLFGIPTSGSGSYPN
jgi:hypothetical protein